MQAVCNFRLPTLRALWSYPARAPCRPSRFGRPLRPHHRGPVPCSRPPHWPGRPPRRQPLRTAPHPDLVAPAPHGRPLHPPRHARPSPIPHASTPSVLSAEAGTRAPLPITPLRGTSPPGARNRAHHRPVAPSARRSGDDGAPRHHPPTRPHSPPALPHARHPPGSHAAARRGAFRQPRPCRRTKASGTCRSPSRRNPSLGNAAAATARRRTARPGVNAAPPHALNVANSKQN